MSVKRRGWLVAWATLVLGGTYAQENVDPPAEIELPADEGDGGSGKEDAAVVQPWTGTFAGGLGEVVRLAANEEHAAALELTDRLLAPDTYARLRARAEEALGPRGAAWLAPLDAPLAWLGLDALDERARAEVRYVRGLLCARTGALVRADEELGLARALAGPGATRNDAVYALGTLDLALAEELRQRIPEISGAQLGAPPGAAGPGGAATGGEDAPDPLELARAAYLEARVHLVERLRLDWRDPNTRANTELVQRRLRELDEIERRREEQQQEEQQQSQEQESEDQDSEDQDSEQQESEDQESQDQESEDSESEDQESEQPQESESDESQESEDAESEEDAEDAESEPEPELEERILTQEEMMRLLEKFQRYQEQGVELLEQNRRVRRENVEKDW